MISISTSMNRIKISMLESIVRSFTRRALSPVISHIESHKGKSRRNIARLFYAICVCVYVLPPAAIQRRHFSWCVPSDRSKDSQLAWPVGRPISRRSLSCCSRISPSRSNLSTASVTRAVSLSLPSFTLFSLPHLRSPLPSYSSSFSSSVTAALFLCRVVRIAPCVSSSRAYIVPLSLPPSSPLVTRASLSLSLKSAGYVGVSSLRDCTCSRVHYGRLQVSRMQAIKCVVVGDGYVIHGVVVKNVSPKFELGQSGENPTKGSAAAAAAARARWDDRRANRVTSGTPKRSKTRDRLHIFPKCELSKYLARELTTPVRDHETTLTCTRVFSRGRHIYIYFFFRTICST